MALNELLVVADDLHPITTSASSTGSMLVVADDLFGQHNAMVCTLSLSNMNDLPPMPHGDPHPMASRINGFINDLHENGLLRLLVRLGRYGS
jgi:hypothetical protein